MRVLALGNMYPPHHLGGYEIAWRSTMECLRERGHDVRVLTTDYLRPGTRSDPGEDHDVRRELRWYWRDHAFPAISLRGRRALELHNLEVLERHLREVRPDVVSWWAMGGMSLSLIERVRRLGLPAVGFVGDEWMGYGFRADAWQRAFGGRGPLSRLAEWIGGVPTRIGLDGAATWIFVSQTVRAKARAAGWKVGKAPIGNVGPDHALFSPRPRPPWRGELLYVGRIDPRKGLTTAVRAMDLLPEARLTVIGGGDDAHLKALRDLARGRGLSDRVEFLRREREELPDAYAHADAVIFPVLWEEPWGVVPLEGMAVGTPVIATGRGGSGEYLRDEENCLVFAPRDDPEALARAVRRLEGDGALRLHLREGGLATATRFSEDSFNETIAEALERAAS